MNIANRLVIFWQSPATELSEPDNGSICFKTLICFTYPYDYLKRTVLTEFDRFFSILHNFYFKSKVKMSDAKLFWLCSISFNFASLLKSGQCWISKGSEVRPNFRAEFSSALMVKFEVKRKFSSNVLHFRKCQFEYPSTSFNSLPSYSEIPSFKPAAN